LIGAAEGRDFIMHARIGVMRALNRNVEREFDSSRKETHWEKTQAQEGPMTTVWIYVDTRHHVGHPGHLKVFANPVAICQRAFRRYHQMMKAGPDGRSP
jgi:hypothetical protein